MLLRRNKAFNRDPPMDERAGEHAEEDETDQAGKPEAFRADRAGEDDRQ
jgi:hypothetical protein